MFKNSFLKFRQIHENCHIFLNLFYEKKKFQKYLIPKENLELAEGLVIRHISSNCTQTFVQSDTATTGGGYQIKVNRGLGTTLL